MSCDIGNTSIIGTCRRSKPVVVFAGITKGLEVDCQPTGGGGVLLACFI